MAALPFNQSQFLNTNLVNIANNNVTSPETGRVPLSASTVTSFYATTTCLNATTGQTENVVSLIQN